MPNDLDHFDGFDDSRDEYGLRPGIDYYISPFEDGPPYYFIDHSNHDDSGAEEASEGMQPDNHDIIAEPEEDIPDHLEYLFPNLIEEVEVDSEESEYFENIRNMARDSSPSPTEIYYDYE